MNRMWMILFLTLVWCGFSNSFAPLNILFGFIAATVCHWLVAGRGEFGLFDLRPWYLFSLLGFTIKELFVSSVLVARDVLTVTDYSHPKIIWVPLSCQYEVEKMMLAALISLTPGTLYIDLSEDRQSLMIHSMFSQNSQEMIDFIKRELEPRIIKVFYHGTN